MECAINGIPAWEHPKQMGCGAVDAETSVSTGTGSSNLSRRSEECPSPSSPLPRMLHLLPTRNSTKKNSSSTVPASTSSPVPSSTSKNKVMLTAKAVVRPLPQIRLSPRPVAPPPPQQQQQQQQQQIRTPNKSMDHRRLLNMDGCISPDKMMISFDSDAQSCCPSVGDITWDHTEAMAFHKNATDTTKTAKQQQRPWDSFKEMKAEAPTIPPKSKNRVFPTTAVPASAASQQPTRNNVKTPPIHPQQQEKLRRNSIHNIPPINPAQRRRNSFHTSTVAKPAKEIKVDFSDCFVQSPHVPSVVQVNATRPPERRSIRSVDAGLIDATLTLPRQETNAQNDHPITIVVPVRESPSPRNSIITVTKSNVTTPLTRRNSDDSSSKHSSSSREHHHPRPRPNHHQTINDPTKPKSRDDAGKQSHRVVDDASFQKWNISKASVTSTNSKASQRSSTYSTVQQLEESIQNLEAVLQVPTSETNQKENDDQLVNLALTSSYNDIYLRPSTGEKRHPPLTRPEGSLSGSMWSTSIMSSSMFTSLGSMNTNNSVKLSKRPPVPSHLSIQIPTITNSTTSAANVMHHPTDVVDPGAVDYSDMTTAMAISSAILGD